MKKSSVELDREDMITLFSDATYGTPLQIYMIGDKNEISKFREEEHAKNDNVCCEDLWADWLLQGHELMLDGNEGWEEGDEDFDEDLNKPFDIETFKRRINDAMKDEHMRRHVTNLINGDDDAITGYCLVQYIAYGEVILG